MPSRSSRKFRRQKSQHRAPKERPVNDLSGNSNLHILIVFLLAVFVYIPSWGGELLWDDSAGVVKSEIIQDPSGWWKAWVAPPRSHPDYFPLTTSTFWIEWRFFGENPLGYRLVNSVLHGLGTVAFLLLLKQLGLPAAFWAAAIFAVHPVNVESVAWISERKNVLSMLFSLLAFSWFLRWQADKSSRTYWFALSLFVAALASKASVVALPLLYLAFLWWRDRRLSGADARGILPFVLCSLFFGLMVFFFQQNRAVGQWEILMPDWLGRLAGAGWAYWHYILTTFWPFQLTTIYPQPDLYTHGFFGVLSALATALVGVLAFLSRQVHLRTIGFAMVACALLLAPVLGFIRMSFMRYALVSDHLQQLVLPVLIGVTVCGLGAVFNRQSIPAVVPRLWSGLAIAVTVLLFSVSWTHARLHASNELLWRANLKRNPESHAAHNFLGSLLAARKDYSQAKEHFKSALALDPNSAEYSSNYAYALLDSGQIDEAAARFQRVVDSGSFSPAAYLGLSQIYAMESHDYKAIAVLTDGARRFPESMTLNAAAAGSLILADRPADALVFLQQCLALDPENPELKSDINYARKLIETGQRRPNIR